MPAKFSPTKTLFGGSSQNTLWYFYRLMDPSQCWRISEREAFGAGHWPGMANDLCDQCVLANKEKSYWDLVPMVVVCSWHNLMKAKLNNHECCQITLERMLNPVYNLRAYTHVKIHELELFRTRQICPKCTLGCYWILRQLHACIHEGI